MPPPSNKQLGRGQKLNKVLLMIDTGGNREVKKPFFLKSFQYLLKRRWQTANMGHSKWRVTTESRPAAGTPKPHGEDIPTTYKTWSAPKRKGCVPNIPRQPFGVFWSQITAPGELGLECSLWGRATALLLHASRTKARCSDVGAAGINSWWSFPY